jgi:hypothetical protein
MVHEKSTSSSETEKACHEAILIEFVSSIIPESSNWTATERGEMATTSNLVRGENRHIPR